MSRPPRATSCPHTDTLSMIDGYFLTPSDCATGSRLTTTDDMAIANTKTAALKRRMQSYPSLMNCERQNESASAAG
jgi:hypothetical protein